MALVFTKNVENMYEKNGKKSIYIFNQTRQIRNKYF